MVALYHPDGYDGSKESAQMGKDIDDLNDEMEAAGVRVFAWGLHPAETSKTVTTHPGGAIVVSEGPYLGTNEHIGGFWVLECAGMKEAVEWGKKATVACRAPVDVRQFH